MDTGTRRTDAKGRVCLPKNFANATMIIEQISETELRLRKALVVPTIRTLLKNSLEELKNSLAGASGLYLRFLVACRGNTPDWYAAAPVIDHRLWRGLALKHPPELAERRHNVRLDALLAVDDRDEVPEQARGVRAQVSP